MAGAGGVWGWVWEGRWMAGMECPSGRTGKVGMWEMREGYKRKERKME